MTEPTDFTDVRIAALSAVFDLDATLDYVKATSRDWRRTPKLRGITCIYDWLSGHSGTTWQERWVAADGDANVERVFREFQAAHASTPAQRNTFRPGYLRHGLSTLIELGLLRPGPAYLLVKNAKIALREVMAKHEARIEEVITHSARLVPVSAVVAWDARHALAAMIATTGRPLPEVTVEDWLAAEAARVDALRPYRRWVLEVRKASKNGTPFPAHPEGVLSTEMIVSLRWPFAAAARASAMAAHPHPAAGVPALPPTLDMARGKPRTTDGILEHYEGVLSGRLYNFIAHVINEHYSGHDFNSKRGLAFQLSTYIRAARKVHPTDHATLRIPRHKATDLIEELRVRPDRSDPSRTVEREALPLLLQVVRRFYELAATTVEELDELRESGQADVPDFADLLGPFPISRQVMNALVGKQKKRTRARLHSQIRIRITTIEDIIPAATLLCEQTEALRAAAEGTGPGECFTYLGVEYRRHDTVTHPASRRPLLNITRTGSHHAPREVSQMAHRAIRTRAFISLLRHTGIRREEAIEIAHDDLVFAMIDGSRVPSAVVGPGKTDTSRTIALHRDTIAALAALIASYQSLFGEVPIATRRDHGERIVLPSRRYLFRNLTDGAFTVPDLSMFADWIYDLINDYNLIAEDLGNPKIHRLRPHDFRRIFATDLLDKDVPIESVRQLLGHKNIATTAVYDRTTWDRAANQFFAAQRAANQKTPTIPCPHCGGTGTIAVPTGPLDA